MKKLNNKGQVLVCFVIMLPILLLAIALIVNLGIYGIEKRKVSNTVRDTIKYGLNHIDDDNVKDTMRDLIIQNIDDINASDINITTANSYIKINVTKTEKALFSGFNNNLQIDVTYSGNISDNGIKIMEE